MVVGIIIIWEGDVCSRGTEVLTGWLVAWLPSVRNRDARTVSERERERKGEGERERSKDGGDAKDGVGWKETRAEEGIQFHCDGE